MALKPLTFRIFGTFEKADDRLTSSYNPGRYFIFTYFNGRFEVKVDDEQWRSSPTPGQDFWIVGRIFSNPFGGVRLEVDDFIEPSDKHPAPDEIEQSQGGMFSGIGKVSRSTFMTKTGSPCYKMTVGAMGLLYDRRIDLNLYEMTPDESIVVISGRLEFKRVFTTKNPNGSQVCELLPLNYKAPTFGRQAPTANKKQTEEIK
ncbi:MAG: hypothetical protein IIW01_08250 [Thermoguttaceae bacterium]|nr:hypothetical protein [Thermoguttaceae bacterium]